MKHVVRSAQHGAWGRRILQYAPLVLMFFVIITAPLLFGAVHPAVQGAYTFVIIVGLGGWLILQKPIPDTTLFSWRWLAIPIALIFYSFLQALPIPLALLHMLSPARAERVEMVNALANVDRTFATLGENGIIGLQSAVYFLALILFYLSFSLLLRQKQRFVLYTLYSIAAVGLFEGIYGLLQVANPGIGILWLPLKEHVAHGTIIYRNQFAAFLNLCWPLAVAGALLFVEPAGLSVTSRNKVGFFKRIALFVNQMQYPLPFFFFAAGVMILAVLFSLSRGGILAMLVVSVLMNALLPLSTKARVLIGIVIISFVAIFGSMLGMEGILARFDVIEGAKDIRLHIYQSSLPMLFDHWLTGIGTDSFKLLSGVYLQAFPENVQYDRVHNDYLELAIEYGLPMTSLLVSWLIFGIVVLGKRLNEVGLTGGDARRSKIIGVAAFCGLLGLLIHGCVDFGWRLPANSLYVMILLALITWAVRAQQDEEHRKLEKGDAS